LSEFGIAESATFQKTRDRLPAKLYAKIRDVVYPQLRRNPFFGPNIRKLRGEFERYYRYRVGSYRLFYLVEEERVLVVVVDLRHRQGAYG
jgi:mRNA interferase RelE/StbE